MLTIVAVDDNRFRSCTRTVERDVLAIVIQLVKLPAEAGVKAAAEDLSHNGQAHFLV
jgi:hypothetical protein